MLFFKTHSANSITDSVGVLLSFRKYRAFLIAINFSSCDILGYIPTTSIVYSIKGGRLAHLDKKSFVSLMYN